MRYKWEEYKWWVNCVIIAIAVFVILCRVDPNTDQEYAKYIFSAISQGLAAILALVITVMFIVAQMTKRYTATKKIILNPVTKFLILVFGTGIILPLFALKFGWFCIGVNLSIVIACFCIALLLPFLKNVSDVLMYDIVYVNLYGEILDAIKLENEAKAVLGIIELETICRDAIKESREETTSEIIHFLSEIGKKVVETKLRNATGNLIVRLGNIGIASIEKGFKDGTLLFLASALSDLRIGAAKNEWEQEAILATLKLKEIGCKAAEKEFILTTGTAIGGLKYVGSVWEGIEFNRQSVQGLCYLGVFATEYLPSLVDRVIQLLKEFERYIVTSSMRDLERSFVKEYPNLKPALEEFKRRYNERQED